MFFIYVLCMYEGMCVSSLLLGLSKTISLSLLYHQLLPWEIILHSKSSTWQFSCSIRVEEDEMALERTRLSNTYSLLSVVGKHPEDSQVRSLESEQKARNFET